MTHRRPGVGYGQVSPLLVKRPKRCSHRAQAGVTIAPLLHRDIRLGFAVESPISLQIEPHAQFSMEILISRAQLPIGRHLTPLFHGAGPVAETPNQGTRSGSPPCSMARIRWRSFIVLLHWPERSTTLSPGPCAAGLDRPSRFLAVALLVLEVLLECLGKGMRTITLADEVDVLGGCGPGGSQDRVQSWVTDGARRLGRHLGRYYREIRSSPVPAASVGSTRVSFRGYSLEHTERWGLLEASFPFQGGSYRRPQ